MTHIELLNEDVQLPTTYTMLPSEVDTASCGTNTCGGLNVYVCGCDVVTCGCNVDTCYMDLGCIHCPLDVY